MDQPCYQGIFVNASIQYFPIMYDVEVEDDCDLVIARGYSIHVIRERFSGRYCQGHCPVQEEYKLSEDRADRGLFKHEGYPIHELSF